MLVVVLQCVTCFTYNIEIFTELSKKQQQKEDNLQTETSSLFFNSTFFISSPLHFTLKDRFTYF